MSGSCGSLSFGLCVTVRVGAVWVWTCVDVVAEASLTCAVRYINVLPTTSFTLVCTLEGASIP